jgi:hypothetical protein
MLEPDSSSSGSGNGGDGGHQLAALMMAPGLR